MLAALRRNKRMGFKRTSTFQENNAENDITFLEWYVFNNLGVAPSAYIETLQTQYYAEQNFRDRRQRNVEFVRGRHFGEIVYDAELQKNVTQWRYLQRRNIPPLTYNVVSKLVRSLTGQFREINTGNIVKCDSKDDRGTELAILLTKCLDRVKNHNKARSKDANNYIEMLLSGAPVCKLKWGYKGASKKADIMFRNPNRSLFGVNPGVVDYDLNNLHTEYEIHNVSINDIIGSFAHGDYERGMEIKRGYINYQGDEKRQSSYSNQSWDGSQLRNNSFYTQGVGNSSHRYYEVWTELSDYEACTEDPLDGTGLRVCHKWRPVKEVQKEVEAENKIRLEQGEGLDPEKILKTFTANFVKRWYVMFITPWGMVLDVQESPYKSGLPPYVFPPPGINGEYWGIVEEVLDAQKSLDRQIQQADAIVANASKGVWVIPDTAVPDGFSNKEYITQLKKADGVIIYKVREGMEHLVPKQVYANSANVGNQVQQLIGMYSGLVDDISGNYGAAQGKDTGASKTASGYAMETQNAGLNIRDNMETYLTMLVDRDDLIKTMIIEGYTEADYLRITGEKVDPKELLQFEFNIEQSKGTNSPGHRLFLEEKLMNLVDKELMPLDVFFEISTNPVMAQAKQKMDEWRKKQEMAQENVNNQPQK